MASQPPGKGSVPNFDALRKSGLVKLNEKALKRQLLQSKLQKVTLSSPSTNNENVMKNVTGANGMEINKKGFLVPGPTQAVKTLHTLDYSRTFYNTHPSTTGRSAVMKSLLNNKMVHTLTGTPEQYSASGCKPITYARELVGLKASPTILLQNVTTDGTVIEDVMIDMEQTHDLAEHFQDCSINIERNEAITCTTAFLSAETLEPYPDTRKPKPRTMATLFEDIANDSDDGMIEHEDELDIVSKYHPWAYSELMKVNSTKQKINNKRGTESDGSESGPRAKKLKKDSSRSMKKTTSDVFEGVSEGNLEAREVNLNELLELNEMIEQDGVISGEDNDNGDKDSNVKGKGKTNKKQNSEEVMLIDPDEIKVEPDEGEGSGEKNDENSNSQEKVTGGMHVNTESQKVEIDVNNCITLTYDDLMKSVADTEQISKLASGVDKDDTAKGAQEKAEIFQSAETEKAKNDTEGQTENADKNVKQNDKGESDEELVGGSSWLDDYIDEFEEENKKDQQESEVKEKAENKEAEVEEKAEENEDQVKEEEMLQDESFTQTSLENYLFYMNQIDEDGRALSPIICEKCRGSFMNARLLFKHLQESQLCVETYRLLESATFAKDPLLERRERYVEVFGCYACSYQSYDPAQVRQHWLREHLEDGLYVCRYCQAEFNTSFRCALHVQTYHSDRPLHVALAPSPMYKQHVVFDLDSVRAPLFLQPANAQVTPELKPKVLEASATPPEKSISLLDKVDNCALCLCCKHCSTEQLFETASALRAHINTYHRASLQCFRCSLCTVMLAGQFDLRRHVATVHHRFIGNAKTFSDLDRSKLERLCAKSHYVNYKKRAFSPGSSQLPYVCSKCYDRRIHKNEGDIPCFASKMELATHHGKEHMGLKKINCLQCNMAYNESGWCTECVSGVDIVHRCYLDALGASSCAATPSFTTGSLRLLVCSVCCFKAEDRAALQTHIKNAHTFCRPYKCSQCNYAAIDMCRMNKHEANAHNIQRPMADSSHDSRHAYYKAVVEQIAAALILDLPATDRAVTLFEGDNVLNRTIDAEVPSENLQLLRQELEPQPPPPEPCLIKRKKSERGQSAPMPPTHTGRMRPCIIDKGLFLDIEERVVPANLVTQQQTDAGAGALQEDDERGMAAALGLPHDDLFPSNSTLTGDRLNNPPYFKCHMCHFDTNRHGRLLEHLQQFHQTDQMGNQGQYWQCYLCGYCAKDRSCIGRHVKYIHMSRRPHSCPYCDYNSIEKTKVRIHVMGNHKKLPVVVRTDDALLHLMSQAVKRYIYYVHGDVRLLEWERQASNPIMMNRLTPPLGNKPVLVSTRVKVNTTGYHMPASKKNRGKKRRRETPDEDAVEWAVYEMEEDQWTHVGLQKRPRPSVPPRYRHDKKLRTKPKVVVKDVMLWMIGKLEKEYDI